jgi:hypothetical protein
VSHRQLGILLLILVLSGIVVITRLSGERIAGTGSPWPQLGAPQARTCITALIDQRGRPPASPTGLLSVGEPAAVFSNCEQPHVGETLASRLLVEPIPAQALTDGQWCRQISYAFLSQRTSHLAASTDTSWWTPLLGFRFAVVLSTPSPSTGYRWAACAVLSPRNETYRGSATMLPMTTPAPFCECRDSNLLVSCTTPHNSQDFGYGVPPPGVDVLASCTELVRHMTGLGEVSANGRLDVEVVRTDGRDVAAPTDSNSGPGLRCRIRSVGATQIAATLTGIGSRPIPWSE